MLSFDSQVRYCKSGYEDADAIMLFSIPRFSNPLTIMTPRIPPMKPPAPCNAEKKNKPPNAEARKFGFMKNVPMITPATIVETTDVIRSRLQPLRLFSSILSYPITIVSASNIKLAPVNPKN